MVNEVVAEATIKLDLACGQNIKEGFDGVDLYSDNIKYRVDLQKYPWPFKDSSIDEIHCSHYVEHIPQDYVNQNGKRKDAFIAFFDECYRILKPGAVATIIVPNARSNRAFQDPTHRRYIVAETFLYLNKEWRGISKLDHYLGECNFGINVVPIIPTELSLLHPEAQARRFNESWNTILDWVATLKAIK